MLTDWPEALQNAELALEPHIEPKMKQCDIAELQGSFLVQPILAVACLLRPMRLAVIVRIWHQGKKHDFLIDGIDMREGYALLRYVDALKVVSKQSLEDLKALLRNPGSAVKERIDHTMDREAREAISLDVRRLGMPIEVSDSLSRIVSIFSDLKRLSPNAT